MEANVESNANANDISSALQLSSAQIARRITIPLHHHEHVSTQENSAAIIDLIAGGIAGSAGIVVGHPFDSIKVRYQMASTSGAGAAASAMSTAQFGGIATLFRGIGAPVAMAALVNASIFTTFGESSRLWDRFVGNRYSSNQSTSTIPKQIVCGSITGIVSSLIICPTEHVKVRLQTQRSGVDAIYCNSFDAGRSILASHGVKGLYRGFLVTCLRQGPGFAAYFGTYDRLKEHGKSYFGNDHSWLPSIMAGGIAGSLSWAVVYPVDLIKSRIQVLSLNAAETERSIWNVAKAVVRQQGWRSLYRGLGVTVFRAFPVNGIIFPTYELTSSVLNDRIDR